MKTNWFSPLIKVENIILLTRNYKRGFGNWKKIINTWSITSTVSLKYNKNEFLERDKHLMANETSFLLWSTAAFK